jgi:type IV pilus assembly protein PilV
LIETLIALLVLSFGLLGMAGLQTYGLRNNNSAYHRSQATLMAYDIVDRMRASRLLAVGTAPVSPSIGASPYNIALGDSPPSTPGATIPQRDLFEWFSVLTRRLPDSDAEVFCNANTAACRVIVQWNDGRSGGARPTCDRTLVSGSWACFRFDTQL